MLGEAFQAEFRRDHILRCTDIDVNESWLDYLDFRDADAYRRDVLQFAPHILVHLGAITDLEYCELHADEAYRSNTLPVESAVWIANELGIPVVYIGTAGIFDGEKDVYDEWDQPNPMGHYARSKFAGEVFVRDHAQRFLICRAGWMMGGGPRKDKKFIHRIMSQLHQGARDLFVVNDRLGTPTYTHDFAANVRVLLEREYWGLYNMACAGMTTRLEVAKELLLLSRLDRDVKIHEVSSDYFSGEFFAPRPKSERLLNRRLMMRGVNVMRDWRIALKEYLEIYYDDYLTVQIRNE